MDRLGIHPWPQWLKHELGAVPASGGQRQPAGLWLGEACRPVADGAPSLPASGEHR